MNNGKIALGVLAGLAAGAILGILFAPDKGSKTRRKIMDSGEDLANDLKDGLNNIVDGVNTRLEGAKQEGRDLINRGKSRFERVHPDGSEIK